MSSVIAAATALLFVMPILRGASLVILILAAMRLPAQQVGGVLPAAVAAPDRYIGNCPARLEFVGHVTVTIPGTTVTYRWERSNGDSGKLLHAQIGTAKDTGNRVTAAIPSDIWHVGQQGRTAQFWEVLHIVSPLDIRTQPANVRVECRI